MHVMRRHTEQDNARVIYDRVSGASRGFAFVSFENVGGGEAATACMQNLQARMHRNSSSRCFSGPCCVQRYSSCASIDLLVSLASSRESCHCRNTRMEDWLMSGIAGTIVTKHTAEEVPSLATGFVPRCVPANWPMRALISASHFLRSSAIQITSLGVKRVSRARPHGVLCLGASSVRQVRH